MQFRYFAAAASAAFAIATAGAASATVTQLQFTAPGQSGEIYFNGLKPNTSVIDADLSASFVLTLTSITNGGYKWNFSYELMNSSSLDSRLSVIGWDVGPDVASVSDVTGLFTKSSAGEMAFVGSKEFCLKSNNGANCSGGGSGGLDDGVSGSGTFALNFVNLVVGGTKKNPTYTTVPAPSSVMFDNFGVRYQSVSGYEATVGVPSAPPQPQENVVAVPEPQSWAMMILGFFGLGLMVRRRRSLARAS